MEYKIEVHIKCTGPQTYVFVTPSPYPTKEDATNVMKTMQDRNPDLVFRVVPDYT